jgi:hypothetical protein
MVGRIGILNTKQKEFNMEFFHFYLDAWKFCKDNHIDATNIKRQDWATWMVEVHAPKKI